MDLTRPFQEISRNDAAIAGGKGASLGEMTQAKIPVPPGFVVLASAFDRFVDENHLRARIEAELDKVNPEEVHTIEFASEAIQGLIKGEAIPQDLKDEIFTRFQSLGAHFVAVRSSATSEDSASAAWAGQLDSYLNTTKETLLHNVQSCWASLFTPRAIAYRFEKGMRHDHISVAVVVQKMVDSEVSGIAFSVHPVTEDYDQLIIEAGYGLGEAIVSGQITPDSYVVDKRDWSMIEEYVSEQERKLVRKQGGGNEWVGCPEGSGRVLTPKQVDTLAKLIVHIEKHYGFPVDVEWAMESGEFYIVQSRPITTLKAKEPEEKVRDVEVNAEKEVVRKP